MFHAFRAGARRASSRPPSLDFAAATAQSSVAMAAVLLVAIEGDRRADEEGSKNTVECEQREAMDRGGGDEPFRNFAATSAAGSAQCEHSSISSFHSGLIPDHDLRLKRALTSRRMAAEKSLRTFFSIYEVEFDNPLGSGTLPVFVSCTISVLIFFSFNLITSLTRHFSRLLRRRLPLPRTEHWGSVRPEKDPKGIYRRQRISARDGRAAPHQVARGASQHLHAA